MSYNIISSFGSIVSVVAAWLFLYIVYSQLIEGKPAGRYPWLTVQFYTDALQASLNRNYPSLEWALSSPPKPHAFVSLPLSTACIHGLTTMCMLCYNAKQIQIINCTHVWKSMSDLSLLNVACDFNLPLHTAAITTNSIVHFCEICQAIACSGCFVG